MDLRCLREASKLAPGVVLLVRSQGSGQTARDVGWRGTVETGGTDGTGQMVLPGGVGTLHPRNARRECSVTLKPELGLPGSSGEDVLHADTQQSWWPRLLPTQRLAPKGVGLSLWAPSRAPSLLTFRVGVGAQQAPSSEDRVFFSEPSLPCWLPLSLSRAGSRAVGDPTDSKARDFQSCFLLPTLPNSPFPKHLPGKPGVHTEPLPGTSVKMGPPLGQRVPGIPEHRDPECS